MALKHVNKGCKDLREMVGSRVICCYRSSRQGGRSDQVGEVGMDVEKRASGRWQGCPSHYSKYHLVMLVADLIIACVWTMHLCLSHSSIEGGSHIISCLT